MRIYIAGKYGNHNLPSEVRLANTMKAIEAGRELLLKGHTPFIPHLTHFIHEGWESSLSSEDWYAYDNEWLRLCDAVLMLDNWRDSNGAVEEHEMALYIGLKIYYDIEDIPEEAKCHQD